MTREFRSLATFAVLTVCAANCSEDARQEPDGGDSSDSHAAGAPPESSDSGGSGASDPGETPSSGSGGSSASSGGILGAGGDATANGTSGATPGESTGGESTAGAGGEPGDLGASSTLVRLPNAEFTPGAPPETSNASELPTISGLKGATATTNGGTTILRIELDGMPGTPRFVVVIDGDDGYFVATATDTNGDGVYEIEIQVGTSVELSTLVVHVAPVDEQGNVGAYESIEYEVVQSGVGEVKVTLSFDQDADLDLHVIEPGGFEISFDLSSSPSGGRLDVDSNASCKIDGKNAENIFWPADGAPDGDYSVFVEYFNPCEIPSDVNYTVTVYNGPGVETFRGTFKRSDAEEKRLITSFVH